MIPTQLRPKNKILGFHQNVFILSLVSFLNDIGGETIKRAIPLYLANILGVKTTIIGLIEGIAEATPQVFQPVSGYLSDITHRRKPLILFGQLLRSTMLLLFWATSWPRVLLLRFLDRSGKGITDAPRDALIVASTVGNHAGRSFGLNRALDDAGSVVGMLFAAVLVGSAATLTRPAFQRIVLLAAAPLAVAFFLIAALVKDAGARAKRIELSLQNSLGHKFYIFLSLSFLFALGNSSDAFLVLKAQTVGMPVASIFLLLAALNLTASLSGLPLASLSDRIGRKRVLLAGWFLYALVYFLYGVSASSIGIISATLLYGLYYGATQGAAKALVADVVPVTRRGTAYGIYNMVVGLTLLPASLIAGWLWQSFTPSAAFWFGSGMAGIAALGLLILL